MGVSGFHILVPLDSRFSPDYQRQQRELGIFKACLCDKKLSCQLALAHKKRGESWVPP